MGDRLKALVNTIVNLPDPAFDAQALCCFSRFFLQEGLPMYRDIHNFRGISSLAGFNYPSDYVLDGNKKFRPRNG